MADALTQIVEKLEENSNILVTVNTNPTVDELSAALGITLLLNKLDKHATAVFSGHVPPALEFLQPEKTFEGTVDSLRDFIIALDKEKADHLRYKVVDDMVKIFITPYRTTINEKDLDFSQGDYNVEAVLAIGVRSTADLDHALESHGRILHDAVVTSISLDEPSHLGGIEWSNPRASGYSELLYALADVLVGENKKMIDEQIATAFLTGIVAATERFSNSKTSSAVMRIAASLMGAGANQQLIATKLEEGEKKAQADEIAPRSKDAQEGESVRVSEMATGSKTKTSQKAAQESGVGTLAISHEPAGDVDEVKRAINEKNSQAALSAAEAVLAKHTQQSAELNKKDTIAAEEKLAEQLAAAMPAVAPANKSAAPSVEDIQRDIARANETLDEAAAQPVIQEKIEAPKTQLPEVVEPTLGGTLNATTEQAAEDARRAAEDDRNKVILSHDGKSKYASDAPNTQAPLNAVIAHADAEPSVPDVLAQGAMTVPTDHAAAVQPPVPITPSVAEPQSTQDDARAAVDAALSGALSAVPVTDGVLPPPPPLPPMPDFSTLPPLPSTNDSTSGAAVPDTLETALPPLPQQTAQPAVAPSAPADPAQFRIPGQ